MESDAARQALADVELARGALADRVWAPRWYHAGIGVCAALTFASFDLPWPWVWAGVLLAALVLPTLLSWAVNRSSGVRVVRWMLPRGSRRALVEQVGLAAVFAVLFVAGFAARSAFGWPWALTAAGVIAAIPTVWASVRLEREHRATVRGRS